MTTHTAAPTQRILVAVFAALALAAGACSNGDDPAVQVSEPGNSPAGIAAEVAGYDLVAGRTGRFIVGLFAADKTRLVGFGTVTFRFAHLDTTGDSEPQPGEPVEAGFLPIPGQQLDPDAPGPRFVTGSEATGVYGAPDVRFDQPGFWEVTVDATIDGTTHATTAAFEVLADSIIPAVGDPAPGAHHAIAGDPDVPARAIDSRAGPDAPIPDPELHSITIADALAAGRPLMVVISTPTYCQSRFCGPITDSVRALALRHSDQMASVHLEIWADFEADETNPAIGAWIAPPGVEDVREPWVFVVDRDGIITHRFDNVATDDELQVAVDAVLTP